MVCVWLRLGMLIPITVLHVMHVCKNRAFFEKLHESYEKVSVQLGSVFPETRRCIFIVGVLLLSTTVRIDVLLSVLVCVWLRLGM